MKVVASFLVQSLSNSSVVVKSSCLVILLGYLLGLPSSVYELFAVRPLKLLPPNFHVWTLVTGLIVESSIINVLIDIPVIILCGQHLEPLWGAMELLKFIAITSMGSTLMTSFVLLLMFATNLGFPLWKITFSGMAGVLGGLSVAFKQLIPDQRIDLRLKQLRVHDLPMTGVLIYSILAVCRLLHFTQPIMMSCGVVIGWTYLRFYQSHGKGMRGDMGEGFSFATLLPKPLRPATSVLSSILYGIMVRAGLCKNPVRTYDVGGPSSITISLPGSDPADAERRRKKALRALNERLTQMQQKNSQDEIESIDGWPVIEDDHNNTSGGTTISGNANQDSINNATTASVHSDVNGVDDDTDSDKNSADSFVKIPKGGVDNEGMEDNLNV